jgi:hypothetical protein
MIKCVGIISSLCSNCRLSIGTEILNSNLSYFWNIYTDLSNEEVLGSKC